MKSMDIFHALFAEKIQAEALSYTMLVSKKDCA